MMRPFLLRLSAVTLGLVLSLALAELGLRLGGSVVGSSRLPLSYDRQAIEQIARGRSYVTFDADLGWVNTPNVDRGFGGVRYRHNSQRMRTNREYSQVPPAGFHRFSAFGDSFTYCWSVDIADCWTNRLEDLLPDTEVLNFGVSGYGPDQAWLRYQQERATWQPCAVLIGYMTENISRVVNRFRPFYTPETGIPLAKPRFLLDGERLALLPAPVRPELLEDPEWVEANLGPHDSWYFPGTFVPNPLDQLAVFSTARTAWYRLGHGAYEEWSESWATGMYRPGSEAFDVLVQILVRFAHQVQADGATPIVLVFPRTAEVVAWRDTGTKPHAPLLEALQQQDIVTIDLTDTLSEQAGSTPLEKLVKVHYRRQGNAAVAHALAEQLPKLTAATCGSNRDLG